MIEFSLSAISSLSLSLPLRLSSCHAPQPTQSQSLASFRGKSRQFISVLPAPFPFQSVSCSLLLLRTCIHSLFRLRLARLDPPPASACRCPLVQFHMLAVALLEFLPFGALVFACRIVGARKVAANDRRSNNSGGMKRHSSATMRTTRAQSRGEKRAKSGQRCCCRI
jgi:hypothetical protein